MIIGQVAPTCPTAVYDDGALPLQVVRVANTTVDRVSDQAGEVQSPWNRAHTLNLTPKATTVMKSNKGTRAPAEL